MILTLKICITVLFIGWLASPAAADDEIRLGMNFPRTGPYSVQGGDQYRAAVLAIEEINASGGILGKRVNLVCRDSKSNVRVTRQNIEELIDEENVSMIFGGSSSPVAIAAGDICQERGIPFFGTLTYATTTTCEHAHRMVFRECYDARMAARVLADYLTSSFKDKKYMYITANYTWGWTMEESLRQLTGTEDTTVHKTLLTSMGAKDFTPQMEIVRKVKPDVLVLVLFGKDMVNAIRQAYVMGLKNELQIVVPNLTLGMAEGGGPEVMAGVVGALPWCWRVPYEYDYPRGRKFVETYAAKYNRYPSTSGASAYTIIYEYKAAVERAESFNPEQVVSALEGHAYRLLKDLQLWRDFDHQSIQTVYAVKCKPALEIYRNVYYLDYFEIINQISGEDAAVSRSEWEEMRQNYNLPLQLESLKSLVLE